MDHKSSVWRGAKTGLSSTKELYMQLYNEAQILQRVAITIKKYCMYFAYRYSNLYQLYKTIPFLRDFEDFIVYSPNGWTIITFNSETEMHECFLQILSYKTNNVRLLTCSDEGKLLNQIV